METPWYTYDEAAALLFRRKATIYTLVCRHRLPRLRLRKLKNQPRRPLVVLPRETLIALARLTEGERFASGFLRS